MRTVLVTPPATEPVTLDQAKQHLRVDHDADDTLITTLIEAARHLVEGRLKQSLVTQTWDFYLDGWYEEVLNYYPGRYAAREVVYLAKGPVQSVASVKYLDGSGVLATWAPSEYIVTPGLPGRITPAYSRTFPTTLPVVDSVVIRYTAGYSTVPGNLRAAMLLVIGHLYENREETISGTIISELPLGVEALLAPHAHRWLN